MNLGNLVGPRSLCPAESNIWDMSHIDKKSWAGKGRVGAQEMPSPTSSPRVEPDVAFLISGFRANSLKSHRRVGKRTRHG